MHPKFILLPIIFALLFLSSCKSEAELKGDVFIVTQGAQNVKLGLVEVSAIPEDKITPFIASKKSARESELKLEYDEAKRKFDVAEQAYNQAESKFEEKKKATLSDYNNAIEGRGFSDQNSSDLYFVQIEKDRTKRELDESSAKLNEIRGKLNSMLAPEVYFNGLPSGIAKATTDADGKFSIKLPSNGRFAIAARGQRKIFDKTEEYYWLVWVTMDGSKSNNIMLTNNNLMDAQSPDSVVQAAKY